MKRNQGFTLIELMIAMVAGLGVATAVHFLGSTTARHFHEQQRISTGQTALRLALNRLRDDFARAGLHGTPNSTLDQACRAQPLLSAVSNFNQGADTPALINAAANNVTADQVTLTGNFATTDDFMTVGISAGGSVITLDTTTQGYRRAIGIPGAPGTNARFAAAFVPGRMVHIRDTDGNNFYEPIGASNAAAATITLATPLPMGTGCPSGFMAGATLAPIMNVQWTVMTQAELGADAANLAPRAAGAAANAMGTTNAYLVRRELDFAGAVIAGTTEVVLEYVANFSMRFIADTSLAGAPPNFIVATPAQLAAAPQQIRSVIIDLSIRSPNQDPTFPFVAPVAGQPLTRYQVNAANNGAARVRSSQLEVFMPNLIR